MYLSREEKQIWPTESLQINTQSCQERSSKQSRHIVTEQSPFSLTSAPQAGHQSIIIKITTIIEQSLHAIIIASQINFLFAGIIIMSPDPLLGLGLALALGTGRLRQTILEHAGACLQFIEFYFLAATPTQFIASQLAGPLPGILPGEFRQFLLEKKLPAIKSR